MRKEKKLVATSATSNQHQDLLMTWTVERSRLRNFMKRSRSPHERAADRKTGKMLFEQGKETHGEAFWGFKVWTPTNYLNLKQTRLYRATRKENAFKGSFVYSICPDITGLDVVP